MVACDEVAALAGAAGECHGCTVHVHFTVSDLVEPSPGEGCFAGWKSRGDSEIVCVWIDGIGVVSVVSGNVFHGATADDGVNDFECA